MTNMAAVIPRDLSSLITISIQTLIFLNLIVTGKVHFIQWLEFFL